MTNTKKSGSVATSTQSLNLVNSSRLKSLAETNRNTSCNPMANHGESLQLDDPQRQYVAEQVARILATLPVGKKQNLFKIRYGLTPEALQELPIEEAAKILHLNLNSDAKAMRSPRTRYGTKQ